MGWERGRYYTRTRRVGDGFVREYVGSGRRGARAAAADRRRRELCKRLESGERSARSAALVVDRALRSLSDGLQGEVDELMRAAGYDRRHGHGYRRRRSA